METSSKIIKNTLFTACGRIWTIALTFILTPFVISHIGVERYAIWAIVGTVIVYFGIMDMGIGSSYLKYVAEYYTKKDYKSINQIVATGITLYILIGIVMMYLALQFVSVVSVFFQVKPRDLNDFFFVFIGVLSIFILRSIFVVYRSIINGMQRMDITNIIAVVEGSVNAVGTVLFLNAGYGLKGLVLSSIIVMMVTIIMQLYYAYRLLPQLSFRFRYLSAGKLKLLVSFGSKIQAARIAEYINLQIDKIFLGHYTTLAMVAYYDLGSKIASFTTLPPSFLLPAIEPASSELNAKDDKERLISLYMRGSKYIAGLVIPLIIFTTVNASLIMHLWVASKDYKNSVLTIQFLATAYSFNILIGAGRLMARGMGIPQYEMRTSIIVSILNITLSWAMILRYGFIGALIGTTIAGCSGFLYFMVTFHSKIGISIVMFIKDIYLKPAAASIAALVSIYIIDFFISLPETRPWLFFILSLKGIVFFFVYTFLLYKTGHLDKYDKEIFLKTRKSILERLTK